MKLDRQSTDSTSATTAKEIQSLMHHLSDHTNPETPIRIDRLRRIFSHLIETNQLRFDGETSGATAQWSNWLLERFDGFVAHLVTLILHDRTFALRTFCGVIAASPRTVHELEGVVLSERLLEKLLGALFKIRGCFSSCEIERSVDGTMLELFHAEFVRPHRDVQYFVLRGVQRMAAEIRGGLERKRKERSAGDGELKCGNGKKSTEISLVDMETNVEIVAENMCRLLMMMDYIAKSQSDLMDESLFLFPPPLKGEQSDIQRHHNDDDDDENSPEEEEDSDAFTSDSDNDEIHSDTKEESNPNGKSAIPSTRSHKNKLVSWQQLYKHRNALQESWLSVLSLQLPPRTQKQVLEHLSTHILTICPTPLRFAEYFSHSFHNGTHSPPATANTNSLIAILSLHGLFILMLDHQLEYPHFYTSLYKLLHPRILYTKHRTKFLRLLSKSLLSNTMLPAYVVAAFCKKLCRMGIAGPTSGALFVLALVSNLLRKHGECACLIHRKGVGGVMEDVFVEDAEDLIRTRALESSLWELSALEKHHHPAVSALAKSCGMQDSKTPVYDMEDFMAHTYQSLFEQEKKRGLGGKEGVGKKGKVSLTFVEPEGLFCRGDVFDGAFAT